MDKVCISPEWSDSCSYKSMWKNRCQFGLSVNKTYGEVLKEISVAICLRKAYLCQNFPFTVVIIMPGLIGVIIMSELIFCFNITFGIKLLFHTSPFSLKRIFIVDSCLRTSTNSSLQGEWRFFRKWPKPRGGDLASINFWERIRKKRE